MKNKGGRVLIELGAQTTREKVLGSTPECICSLEFRDLDCFIEKVKVEKTIKEPMLG